MVLDRGQRITQEKRAPATLYLYDLDGREIWHKEQPEGSAFAALTKIDWLGPGAADAILMYGRGHGQPVAILDGEGKIIDTFQMQCSKGRTEKNKEAAYYCLAADVWGDSREEVILSGSRGACIYANARPLATPTLYNETLYPGM